jgi:hypothetical protein
VRGFSDKTLYDLKAKIDNDADIAKVQEWLGHWEYRDYKNLRSS